jgi:hypothetical protein
MILIVMAAIGWTANRFYDVPVRQRLRRTFDGNGSMAPVA